MRAGAVDSRPSLAQGTAVSPRSVATGAAMYQVEGLVSTIQHGALEGVDDTEAAPPPSACGTLCASMGASGHHRKPRRSASICP